MLKPYTIVSSHYTGWVFAWPGTPAANKKYLGNRTVIGTVTATSSEGALERWQSSLQIK